MECESKENQTEKLDDEEEKEIAHRQPTTIEKVMNRKHGRIVGEIVEQVRAWRKLCEGSIDPDTGTLIRLDSDDAAAKIGMAKKTLQNYRGLIR